MERCFVIWLHPFCLSVTPLKSFLISSYLRQLIFIIIYHKNIFYKEKTCVHLELQETKSITHFLLLKAHPH